MWLDCQIDCTCGDSVVLDKDSRINNIHLIIWLDQQRKLLTLACSFMCKSVLFLSISGSGCGIEIGTCRTSNFWVPQLQKINDGLVHISTNKSEAHFRNATLYIPNYRLDSSFLSLNLDPPAPPLPIISSRDVWHGFPHFPVIRSPSISVNARRLWRLHF
jgi:hypothetical protein